MSFSRRDALKFSGAAAAALAVSGCGASAEAKPSKSAETVAPAAPATKTHMAPLPEAKGKRIVVVGGGWSGLSFAKEVKKLAPNAEVVMVEARFEFMSCPLSNLWMVGAIDLEFLTHDYLAAARNNNYTFFNATAYGADKKNKTLHTSNGDIKYDYLVLAPGIDYDYSGWTNGDLVLERRLRTEYPAGFKPGSEHITLRNKVLDFEEGNFILTVPAGNYRCLPAPYERACLIADYFKREGIKGKVILLDENAGITIKKKGFSSAFEKLYGDYLEYHPSSKIETFDLDAKTIETEFGDKFEFADAAFYPHVRGAQIVEDLGLAKDRLNKLEGNIDFFTNEAVGAENKDIFIIGDSRPMGFSKSGNTSNAEGKLVAKGVAARVLGKAAPKWSSPLTICYSAISVDPVHAISVNAQYEFNKEKGAFGFAHASTNEDWSGASGLKTGKGLFEWAKGMYRDMFA